MVGSHGGSTDDCKALRVRVAGRSDVRLVWDWANDPAVRRNSFSSDHIPWTDHVAWFGRMQQEPDRLLLIGELPDGPDVGLVRFEPDSGGGYALAVVVAREYRGRGLASPLITAAVARWRTDHPSAVLRARIKVTNRPSINAFVRAGFVEVEDDENHAADHVVMSHPPPDDPYVTRGCSRLS